MASQEEEVKVQRKQLDGRLTIEVVGRRFVVSENVRRVVNELSKLPAPEEVRFVAADSLHIDVDLGNEVWHGKNVVVVTKSLNVSKPVAWNVSGKNNGHAYGNNAGTDEHGNGKQGNDGFPGESGGNVLILANRFTSLDNLTIISNGGSGSKGQDGGNGKNGPHGIGITTTEFDEKFPATARFAEGPKIRALKKTLESLEQEARTMKTQWLEKTQFKPFYVPIITDDVCREALGQLTLNNIYLEVVTNEGTEITFSFEHGGLTTNSQSFLLFKGSPGKPGGQGGEHGLGGQGGYAGEITVKNLLNNQMFHVTKCNNNGEDGPAGRGGLYGNHGKNGCDMGYTDYAVANFFTEDWPRYFGRDGKSKLALDYENSDSATRIYCPYRKDWEYKYATIKESAIEHSKQTQYEQRHNARKSGDRKHHALSTKKKPMLENSIRGAYSGFINSVQNSTANLNLNSVTKKSVESKQTSVQIKTTIQTTQKQRSPVCTVESTTKKVGEQVAIKLRDESKQQNAVFHLQDSTKQASEQIKLKQEEEQNTDMQHAVAEQESVHVEHIVKEQEKQELPSYDVTSVQSLVIQEQKQTLEPAIKRQVTFVDERIRKPRNVIEFNATMQNGNDDSDEVDSSNIDYNVLQNWPKLRNKSFSHDALQCLFVDWKVAKTNYGKQCSTDKDNQLVLTVDKLLLDKYRLATMEKISKQLPLYDSKRNCAKLSAMEAIRYLIEDEQGDSNISHHVLGTLNQYLYEDSQQQREHISRYCSEELRSDQTIIKRSLKTYVLRSGSSDVSPACIKPYFDEYKAHFETQEKIMNAALDEFERQLSQPKHAQILRLWNERSEDEPVSSELEKIIAKDPLLNIQYGHLKHQYKFQYGWERCCQDKDVLKHFFGYIRDKGLKSRIYRDLLAFVFGINLRIYTNVIQDERMLQDNHNPSSKSAIHVQSTNSEFVPLKIDEHYLRLEQERQGKDLLYDTILAQVQSLAHQQELDDYFRNKTYLDDTSLLRSANEIQPKKPPNNNSSDDDEDRTIHSIAKYFPEEERPELTKRLEKIKSEYIGQRDILSSVAKRFSSEGMHVLCEQMCFAINCIVAYCAEERLEQYTFAWLVAANHQGKWVDELVLLLLENHFKKQLAEKLKWREYLSRILNKEVVMLLSAKLNHAISLTTDHTETVFYLLSNIPSGTVYLEGLELSEWPYALKEKYWLCKLERLTGLQQGELLSAASYYVLSIENTFGNALVEALLARMQKKKNTEELGIDILTGILFNFHSEKWNLCNEDLNTLENNSVNEWTSQMHKKYTPNEKERTIVQLTELIRQNTNSSAKIIDKLPSIESSVIQMSNMKYSIQNRAVSSFAESDITIWASVFKESVREGCAAKEREQMLAVVDRAVELRRGFRLRDTQRLAVLALLANERSTLAQVSTGEGKSLIVVTASLMKALLGEKVDIVTSSSVLAKRDADNNRDIYDLFGVNVAHNCSEDVEKRKEAYAIGQVVYGDLASFQRDYLLDRFYGKNILGDRNFVNVIVDEVDSMLVDKGNNMLYLSHDIAGMDKLESVYLFIWKWISRPVTLPEELACALDVEAIQDAVLGELYGIVTEEDIGKLDGSMSDRDRNVIWSRLVKASVLDVRGRLLMETISDNTLSELLKDDFSKYKDRIRYLLEHRAERERSIPVPNYLRSFVERHLKRWINSAINAFFMNPGHNYVVDVDRTGTSSDRNANIIIIDNDTGTDQANSQWDEALHQFLQLKHGCKLSMQSLKAVFISNVSYFKLYRQLYGLTGTLGSHRERDLLREIHSVDFVTIPTARSKQFHEDIPMLCSNSKERIQCILHQVKLLTEENMRSVLIICQTVKDAEDLHEALGGPGATNVHCYVRDYEEFEVVQGIDKLGPGKVIIATNLAGRGTDIQLSDDLRKAGGLHVLLTYLPGNMRIEEQAFGRAARSGDKGSGQLIIVHAKGTEYSKAKILNLKKERDVEELVRVSAIKSYYDSRITAEETCFKAFKNQYEKMKNDLAAKWVPSEVKDILLQSCLDKWAFWLDENSEHMSFVENNQNKTTFGMVLDQLISSFNRLDTGLDTGHFNASEEIAIIFDTSCWLPWVQGNPSQMVKLAKHLSQHEPNTRALSFRDGYGNALKLLEQVIQMEPHFCEAAHYYKAFAIGKKVNWEQKPKAGSNKDQIREFKKELRAAAQLFEEHSSFAINAAGFVASLKEVGGESIQRTDGYEEQKKSVANLYSTFVRSIDDILGSSVTPQSFVNYEIKDTLADSLFTNLRQSGILQGAKLRRKMIADETLKPICLAFGVSTIALKKFLSSCSSNIDEKAFRNALKRAIALPGREEFWKILSQQEALTEVVRYVIVDEEKMKAVDFSLLDFVQDRVKENELKRHTIECNKDQMVLYTEHMATQNVQNMVFVKEEFIKLVGKTKYKLLKGSRVLSFNKKANVDANKLANIVLPSFDSITVKDIIARTTITESEAEIILTELVEQKVLGKDPDTDSYKLTINFDEMPQDLLLSCPAYEHDVRSLLTACFSYRLVLQKVKHQLEETASPIRVELVCRPHQSLFFELVEQKIIRPTIVMKGNAEEKYKQIYMPALTTSEIKRIFSLDGLVLSNCADNASHSSFESITNPGNVFDRLFSLDWIVDQSWAAFAKDAVLLNTKCLKDDLYCISEAAKRKRPWNGLICHRVDEGEFTRTYNHEKTIELQLDNYLRLSQKIGIKHVTETLAHLRGTMKTLKVPNVQLKSLVEFYTKGNFENIDEMRVFLVNGLDELIQLGEKQWTREMLINTGIVVLLGLAQIAIGAAIELFYAGLMTHVGAAFITEGVNDLIYAAGALKSGHFSWSEYREQKLQSVLITAASGGIAACFSWGAKVSRYGYKLAGPSFELGGKKLAETSGKQLVSTVTKKLAAKEVAKRIVVKATEGVVYGLVNAAVDSMVESHLQAACDSIAGEFLANTMKAVENHHISHTLKEAYETLGADGARQMVNDVSNNDFSEQMFLEKYGSVASKVTGVVTQGVADAVKKMSKTSASSKVPIGTICQVATWAGRAAELGKVLTITSSLLDYVDQELKNKIKQNVATKHEDTEQDFESFRREVVDQWKALLKQRVGRFISQHIVTPILRAGTNSVIQYVGKQIKAEYRSYKDEEYAERFKELKRRHKAQLQHGGASNDGANQHTEQYHEDLLKLMRKTRNPTLLASIVRENVPMDFTCVSACSFVARDILQNRGIDTAGLTIVVEGENGIKQTFCSAEEGRSERVVTISLSCQHYELCGSDPQDQRANRTEGTNNCLYEALAKEFPELRSVGANAFRNEVASAITHEPELQHHIRQGWHKLPISLGAYGGNYRAKSDEIPDESSSTIDESTHLGKHRFRRTVRFAGLQRLGPGTLPVDERVLAGKSVYQDRRSKQRGRVGAHIVQGGAVNPALKTKYPWYYKMMRNFLGRTHQVDCWANVYRGVGGDIDQLQRKFKSSLNSIDYDIPLTYTSRAVLREFKTEYEKVLTKHISNIGTKLSKNQFTPNMIEKKTKQYTQLKMARHHVNQTSLNDLFRCGKVSFNDTKVSAYMGK